MPYRDDQDGEDAYPPPSVTPGHAPAPRVVIISASVGAGHDGAATELARRLQASGFLVDRHDFLDLLPVPLGKLLSGGYHRLLAWAPSGYQRIHTATAQARRPGPAVRTLLRSAERRTLRTVTADTHAVVATYPGASQVLGTLRRRGRLSVPALTYLTDFSVHPLWIAPGIDAHLAVHPVPARQARAQGATAVTVTGPVCGPWFAPATAAMRRAARARFGLPEQSALALLVAGSWGVGPVELVASEIQDSGAAVPVVVCGHNHALADRLRRNGIHAYGWVEDMPGLMQACDVLVQNAGGLTCLEAFATGLPVASYRCIPGHGQTNAAALHEAGLATWIRKPADLKPVLADLLDGPLGHQQRAKGLALYGSRPGPAVIIASAGRAATTRHSRVPGQRPGRRITIMAAALAVTVALGINIPLAHSHSQTPGRFGALVRLLEAHDL